MEHLPQAWRAAKRPADEELDSLGAGLGLLFGPGPQAGPLHTPRPPVKPGPALAGLVKPGECAQLLGEARVLQAATHPPHSRSNVKLRNVGTTQTQVIPGPQFPGL